MFPTRRVRGVCDVCETATWKATRRPTVNMPSHKFKHRNRISKTHLIWRNSDLLIIICGFLLREHFPWSFPCQAERWATCPSNSAIKWQSPRVKPRSVPPGLPPTAGYRVRGLEYKPQAWIPVLRRICSHPPVSTQKLIIIAQYCTKVRRDLPSSIKETLTINLLASFSASLLEAKSPSPTKTSSTSLTFLSVTFTYFIPPSLIQQTHPVLSFRSQRVC